MNNLKRVLFLLVLLVPLKSLAEQPELGKYPKVYSADSYKITVLRIGKDESTVLVKVDGLDNKFDGQIYKHTRICENTTCTTYKYETTEIPGKVRWWTIQSSRSYGDYDNMSFYPPGIDRKYSLHSGKPPSNFDSMKFYQEYLGQVALRKK